MITYLSKFMSLRRKGEFMKDCVIIGMALGFVAGALLVSNNSNAQKMVEKGKKAVKDQVKKITD